MKKTLFISLIGLLLIFVGCKTPEARKPVTNKSGSYTRSIEMNKERYAIEEKDIKAAMAEKDTIDFKASSYGFWYYYNNEIPEESDMPDPGEIVEFEYNVKNLEGKTIYTADELGKQTYRMDKEELFTGLREGLKLMREGETVTFVFPSYKAYGYYGDLKRIGTNMPIVATVTLHNIKSSNIVEP